MTDEDLDKKEARIAETVCDAEKRNPAIDADKYINIMIDARDSPDRGAVLSLASGAVVSGDALGIHRVAAKGRTNKGKNLARRNADIIEMAKAVAREPSSFKRKGWIAEMVRERLLAGKKYKKLPKAHQIQIIIPWNEVL